jgi:hypothetical protein
MVNLFRTLRAHIQSEIPEIKKVGLWNNQYMHLLQLNPDEAPFRFPACFIELRPFNFRPMGAGIQEYDMHLLTYLGFKSFENEDDEVLELKQRLHAVIQGFQNGYFATLSRISEQPDYNHPSVQVYTTTYLSRGIDYTNDIRGTASTHLGLSLSAQTALYFLSGST